MQLLKILAELFAFRKNPRTTEPIAPRLRLRPLILHRKRFDAARIETGLLRIVVERDEIQQRRLEVLPAF